MALREKMDQGKIKSIRPYSESLKNDGNMVSRDDKEGLYLRHCEQLENEEMCTKELMNAASIENAE